MQCRVDAGAPPPPLLHLSLSLSLLLFRHFLHFGKEMSIFDIPFIDFFLPLVLFSLSWTWTSYTHTTNRRFSSVCQAYIFVSMELNRAQGQESGECDEAGDQEIWFPSRGRRPSLTVLQCQDNPRQGRSKPRTPATRQKSN